MDRKKEIALFVEKRINYICAVSESNSGKAILANLRKGVGKNPGELPQVFPIIFEDLPEVFMSRNGVPTKEEWACYIALTLFSWHQQSHDTHLELVHTSNDQSMGRALRCLADQSEDTNSEARMLKRLQVLVSSMDIKEFAYHSRNIVKLFSSSNVKMNYASFAADVYEWQFPESNTNVGLRWGQDFYRQKTNLQEEIKDE